MLYNSGICRDPSVFVSETVVKYTIICCICTISLSQQMHANDEVMVDMPKYLSIANQIEQQITSHTLQAGARLPTEKELMVQFGVSRQTIRNAFAALMEKKLIYAVKGSGTFVSKSAFPVSNSKNIAVLITDADSYIFPYKSASINSVLTKHGYISNIFISHNRIDYEENTIREILSSNYAGAIIQVTKAVIPRVSNLLSELNDKLPLVLIDGYYPEFPSIPYISMDDRKGGYKATEYLVQHGHKKIFHVGKVDDLQGLLRYKGYVDALNRYHLEFSEDHVFWITEASYSHIPEYMMETLCRQLLQCTAVFFYNDQVASKVVQALLSRGVKIPEDLSVMSYDNSLLSMHPFQLSCVSYPLTDLGKIAAEHLLRRIDDPNFDATYLFEPEIIERTSVKTIETP